MAPSTRALGGSGQVRPTTKIGAFRVTKPSRLNEQPQITKQKLRAIEDLTRPQEKAQPKAVTNKRRRDAVDSEHETEEVAARPKKSIRKARPADPLIDDRSLSPALQELSSLHKSFAQALAVHYAHNGSTMAVVLTDILPVVTRLWKRRTVNQQDIQRLLGVWEMDSSVTQSVTEVEHRKGPFRLITTGIGLNSRVKLEYMWSDLGLMVETDIHRKYEEILAQSHTSRQHSPDLSNHLDNIPLLACQIGTQTQVRREKINTIRNQILNKPANDDSEAASQSLDLSKLDISDSSDAKTGAREVALKSRTLSMFDRLRAKQLTTSNSALTSTPGDLLRRRALHRIPDIIDILRLKQARKLNNNLQTDVFGSPSEPSTRNLKVSFSLDSLVQEIRDSGKSHIPADEIKECISILGKEIPDPWCNLYSMGHARCVTLQGEGWKKEAVRDWCEKELASAGKL